MFRFSKKKKKKSKKMLKETQKRQHRNEEKETDAIRRDRKMVEDWNRSGTYIENA